MSHPRYFKQRDFFRCGPVAILNALKWAGVPVTVKHDLPRLCRMSECDNTRSGSTTRNMDSALRQAGRGHFKVRLVRRPKLHEIESHLRDGGALIIDFYWKEVVKDWLESSRHYVLLSDMSFSGERFGMVNYRRGRPTYTRIHRDTIKKDLLRYQSVDKKFKAWFLTPEGNCID